MLRSIILPLVLLLSITIQTFAVSVPGSVPGTTSHYAQVGGNLYHYLRSRPSPPPVGTILLLHGYPDLPYGWRNQIPYITSLGYQVIAPDMLGYADTDAPADLAQYARKKLSADMALLMDQIVPGEQIIVGGHDWGAVLAYKMAVWYPNLIRASFTASVPYWPPVFGLSAAPFVDIPELVLNQSYHTLGYERQWGGFAYERNFENDTEIYWLLNGIFGGVTADNKSALSPFTGWDLDLLSHLRRNTLLNSTEMDFYVQGIAKKGMRGPSNWYRVYQLDWEDELAVARAGKIVYRMPALFIADTQDPFIPKWTWDIMKQHFANLTIEPVDAGHWVLQEAPEDVNRILGEWLSSLGS